MRGGSDKNINRTYTPLVPTLILVFQNASHISKYYPKVEGSHGLSVVDYFFVSITKGGIILRSVVLSPHFSQYAKNREYKTISDNIKAMLRHCYQLSTSEEKLSSLFTKQNASSRVGLLCKSPPLNNCASPTPGHRHHQTSYSYSPTTRQDIIIWRLQ